MSNKSSASIYNTIYHKLRPALDKMRSSAVSPDDLLLMQFYDGVFCHYDIIIKYMVLEHEFMGLHPDIWDTYSTLQMRGNEDFRQMRIKKFRSVIDSLSKDGYTPKDVISVDDNMLIRDGSHRVAMASFFKAETVNVIFNELPYEAEKRTKEYHNYPFTESERALTEEKLAELLDKANQPLQIVLLGSSCEKAGELCKILAGFGQVTDCSLYHPNKSGYADICRRISAASDFNGKGNRNIKTDDTRMSVIKLKLSSPRMTVAKVKKTGISGKLASGKVPAIVQSSEIASAAAEKLALSENQLFIPQNFLINSRFCHILGNLQTD